MFKKWQSITKPRWSDIITCWVRSWCRQVPVCPAGPPPSALLLGNEASWPQAPPAASSVASLRFPAPAANTQICLGFHNQIELQFSDYRCFYCVRVQDFNLLPHRHFWTITTVSNIFDIYSLNLTGVLTSWTGLWIKS